MTRKLLILVLIIHFVNCDQEQMCLKAKFKDIVESGFLPSSEISFEKAILMYRMEKVEKMNFPTVDILESKEIILDSCGCKKTILISKDQEFNSLCSDAASKRGKGQKVISYTYFGDPSSKHHKEKKYYEGISKNILAIKKYYKGWTMRIYHDFNLTHPHFRDLCKLSCSEPILDLCYVRNRPKTS